MAVVDVEVEGLKEVVAELARMPEEGKKRIHMAVNKGAQYLLPHIIRSIERGGVKKGAHLKDAIRLRKAKPRRRTSQSADIVGGRGKTVDYGFHVEAGTRTMEGKSFMRKATDREAEAVANIVINDLLRGLGVD